MRYCCCHCTRSNIARAFIRARAHTHTYAHCSTSAPYIVDSNELGHLPLCTVETSALHAQMMHRARACEHTHTHICCTTSAAAAAAADKRSASLCDGAAQCAIYSIWHTNAHACSGTRVTRGGGGGFVSRPADRARRRLSFVVLVVVVVSSWRVLSVRDALRRFHMCNEI